MSAEAVQTELQAQLIDALTDLWGKWMDGDKDMLPTLNDEADSILAALRDAGYSVVKLKEMHGVATAGLFRVSEGSPQSSAPVKGHGLELPEKD